MTTGVVFAMLLEIASFFIKVAIIVIAILIILAFVLKSKVGDEKITIKDLNKKYKSYKKILQSQILDKKQLKKWLKTEETGEKKKKKNSQPKTFVVDFKGDIKASAVEDLRECVTAILSVATPEDEVVICLESPGGMVHGYGLAASQLQRIKAQNIKLVACVDKIAASGGYMMACLADHIISAPFAIIGSVGVLAQVPNFNKVLKKNDIDYYQVTAGKYKRTLTFLGEVTEDGLEKFKEDIETTHELFKNHVSTFRPKVDIEEIATGEHWYGQQALELKLVDELGTSDDYLLKQSKDRILKHLEHKAKKTMKEKLADGLTMVLEKSWDKVMDKLHTETRV